MSIKQRIMAIHDETMERLRALASPMAEAMPEKQRIDGFVIAANEVLSSPEQIDETERLRDELGALRRRNAELMSMLSRMAGDA